MARKLVVEIIGDASSLEKSFKQAGAHTNTFGDSLKRVGKIAAFTAGGAALGGLFVTLKRGIGEFNESQQVMAQTVAGLKSTGKAAGVTAKQVGKLATAVSIYSGIDDEAVQAGENMLLTFTNIRNETGKGNKIFDQATRAVADLATKMNNGAIPSAEQLKTASIQLGKALNDPIKGIGALRRVGVSFTEEQKHQIETLIKSGHQMEAQKIILGELRKEFGGAAKAAGGTFAGSMAKLSNTFDNLAGTIVGAAAPAVQKYVDKLNVWLSKEENQKKIQDAVTNTMRVLGNVIRTIAGIIERLAPKVQAVVDTFGGWKRVIELLIALKLARVIYGWAAALRVLGASAVTANAGAVGLLGSLAGIAAFAAKGFSVGGAGVESRTPTFSGGKWHLGGKTLTPSEANAIGLPKSGPKTAPQGPTGPQGAPRGPSQAPSGPHGPTGGRGSVVFNGPVNVHGVADPTQFLTWAQRTARKGSPSRSGPFAGHNLGLT